MSYTYQNNLERIISVLLIVMTGGGFLLNKQFKDIAELKAISKQLADTQVEMLKTNAALNAHVLQEKSTELIYKGWFFNDPLSDTIAITGAVVLSICLIGITVYYFSNGSTNLFGPNDKGDGGSGGGSGIVLSSDESAGGILDLKGMKLKDFLETKTGDEVIIFTSTQEKLFQEIQQVRESIELHDSYWEAYFVKVIDLVKKQDENLEYTQFLTEKVGVLNANVLHKADFTKFIDTYNLNASNLNNSVLNLFEILNQNIYTLAGTTTEIKNSFQDLINVVSQDSTTITSVLEINNIVFNSLICEQIFIFIIFLFVVTIEYSINLQFHFLKYIKINSNFIIFNSIFQKLYTFFKT